MSTFDLVYNKYNNVIKESFTKKISKTNSKDIEKKSEIFLPEDYIEIALVKYLHSKGVYSDIDIEGIKEVNPIDKSVWYISELGFEEDDSLVIKWLKTGGDGDDYVYESFFGQNEEIQRKIFDIVVSYYDDKSIDPKVYYAQTLESFTKKISKTSDLDIQKKSDISLPDDYIEKAIMYFLVKHDRYDIYNFKRKYRREDDGENFVLQELIMQDDGQEIQTHASKHYLECGWSNSSEFEENDDVIDYYLFKDEDKETQLIIYKFVLFTLGEIFIDPKKVYLDFDDEFDS